MTVPRGSFHAEAALSLLLHLLLRLLLVLLIPRVVPNLSQLTGLIGIQQWRLNCFNCDVDSIPGTFPSFNNTFTSHRETERRWKNEVTVICCRCSPPAPSLDTSDNSPRPNRPCYNFQPDHLPNRPFADIMQMRRSCPLQSFN